MENSFKSIIEQSNSILILMPVRPYFDQVAAGLSLYLALKQSKEVTVSCPSPMTVEFNRLVGVNKLSSELGNKNLIIKFTDYKASDIERVSYDIEDGQFRLTVIPKPGVSAPQKDQAELSYTGVASDTVILVGGVNESHFPALSSNELAGVKLIHVGNRSLNLSRDKSVISFAKSASSVSEVAASLIKESNYEIDTDVATNLLLGIEEGTNKFSTSEVTAETFQLVAELMRAGGQRARRVRPPRQTFPTGAIPGQVPQPRPQQVIQPQVVKPQAKKPVTKIKEEPEETPKDWLEPKIFKGTSVS